ncbi:MAG TPA: ABC transporter substrate-binding protein [Candidatus Binataceae bacterium]|nr:ABC transporter substrate-binding protein [Candidatus Binataceae bacterium]
MGRGGQLFLAGVLALTLSYAGRAQAADRLRVGDPSVQAFSFVPLDVGLKFGIFQKYGIELERISVSGSAKVHQAMTAGALDIAVAAGPDLQFLVKGAPEIGVASMAGPPLLLGFDVRYDAPYKTAADLKGARIGVSTVGSLTEWLVLRLAAQQGWSRNDFTLVTVGAETPGQTAALLTKQIDAVVSSSALGLQLAEDKKGRLLFPASDIVTDFIIHIIYASDDLVHNNPDAVRRFLKGWFETIAFMRAHKAETVEVSRARTHYSEAVEDQEYDRVMPMFSDDGKFSPSAVNVLAQSFVDLKILDAKPDLTKYFTEEYLPKN